MRQLKYVGVGRVFDKIDDRIYLNTHRNFSQLLITRFYDKLRRRIRRPYDWLYREVTRLRSGEEL